MTTLEILALATQIKSFIELAEKLVPLLERIAVKDVSVEQQQQVRDHFDALKKELGI